MSSPRGRYYVFHYDGDANDVTNGFTYSDFHTAQGVMEFLRDNPHPEHFTIYGGQFYFGGSKERGCYLKGPLTGEHYTIGAEKKKRNPEVDRIMREFDQVISNLRNWVEKEVD